jgi:lipopolysaccharide export system protein LptA
MRIIGFVVFTFGIYFEGGLANEEQWVAKVKEMEAKVAAAEVAGKKETIKIQQKVVVQEKVIREKGEDIVRYIDREIVKYDNSCIIPKEVIDTHNKAAKRE